MIDYSTLQPHKTINATSNISICTVHTYTTFMCLLLSLLNRYSLVYHTQQADIGWICLLHSINFPSRYQAVPMPTPVSRWHVYIRHCLIILLKSYLHELYKNYIPTNPIFYQAVCACLSYIFSRMTIQSCSHCVNIMYMKHYIVIEMMMVVPCGC